MTAQTNVLYLNLVLNKSSIINHLRECVLVELNQTCIGMGRICSYSNLNQEPIDMVKI